MQVVMEPGATEEQIEAALRALANLGLTAERISGKGRAVLTTSEEPREVDIRPVRSMPGVVQVVDFHPRYHLPSRAYQPADTVVRVGEVAIGGPQVVVFAGPCSVEDEAATFAIAQRVRAAGAKGLRGGAFKPRSSPYSFQGLGEEGLRTLRAAANAFGLLAITEVLDPRHVEMTAQNADILQIGSRNMENYPLLREVGRAGKPVLLKRGRSALIEEWLMAAEYIMVEGNSQVILCERGIRTFEGATRNTLDISAIPVIKQISHLPILVDPSHGTGLRGKVLPMSRAAIAAGADGLLIEVHAHPEDALSDGAQSIRPDQFDRLMAEVAAIAQATGRAEDRSLTVKS